MVPTAAMYETEMKNIQTDWTNNSGNIEDTNLGELVPNSRQGYQPYISQQRTQPPIYQFDLSGG